MSTQPLVILWPFSQVCVIWTVFYQRQLWFRFNVTESKLLLICRRDNSSFQWQPMLSQVKVSSTSFMVATQKWSSTQKHLPPTHPCLLLSFYIANAFSFFAAHRHIKMTVVVPSFSLPELSFTLPVFLCQTAEGSGCSTVPSTQLSNLHSNSLPVHCCALRELSLNLCEGVLIGTSFSQSNSTFYPCGTVRHWIQTIRSLHMINVEFLIRWYFSGSSIKK